MEVGHVESPGEKKKKNTRQSFLSDSSTGQAPELSKAAKLANRWTDSMGVS